MNVAKRRFFINWYVFKPEGLLIQLIQEKINVRFYSPSVRLISKRVCNLIKMKLAAHMQAGKITLYYTETRL